VIPTLVIGLREGLEASLIVGIIASFLARNGRRDALRATWIGVIAATILCVVVGIALVKLSEDLPQQAQEGLETVIGALAVVMVTSMIIWMNKHARSMKRELEGAAAQALARGSAGALVAMAFLAVLREGFETAVFLVSVLENSNSVASATAGAVIGIVIAVAIGYGIYRGGVRLNLARFFKITGVVLVIVAAGLTMTVLRTAHEAGWLNVGQATPLDLSWLVAPGTVQASLLTGVLGLSAHPTVIEMIAWVLYAVPMVILVVWPKRSRTTSPAATSPAASATSSASTNSVSTSSASTGLASTSSASTGPGSVETAASGAGDHDSADRRTERQPSAAPDPSRTRT
jgi:high-affinity iron transporter